MRDSILTLKDINLKLSDYFQLTNINFNLLKGEVHVLIGENGSGKTSLMNIILGRYSKDSGEIIIDKSVVLSNSPKEAKKLGITMIHQESSLFENFSVAENIFIDNKPYLNKALKIINWREIYSQCRLLFKKFNIALDKKALVETLNLAQKQLVEICRAYISNARIIIMDEPTSSLTEAETSLLFNIIRELKKSGVAIIYISHRIDEILDIGDRISVIRNGEIIGTQDMSKMNVDNIIQWMTGQELKNRYPKLDIKPGREILKISGLSSDNIIKDINFSLKKGEILGIIGLAGSGRSKIAKCLFGIDKIDSGDIFIDNQKIKLNSPSDAINTGIAYVTEDRTSEGLFMYLNVTENISAPNTRKITDKYIIDRNIENNLCETYVENLRIKVDNINDKAALLSGGNQQKLVLAKWIMSKAKIMIFDEPTRGIDITSKVDVYNVMNEMVMKGISIILISSDVNEILGMCDRVIVLYKGRIKSVVSRSDATHEKIMAYATGGKKN